jgi:hypothetical protein
VDSEVLTFFAALAAAVIGGSGIAGLVAGGAELGKRSRLRRRVEKGIVIRDLLAQESPERAAMDHAIAADAARLAALSVVGIGGFLDVHRPLLIMSGGFVVSALATVVGLNLEAWQSKPSLVPVPVVIALVVVSIGVGTGLSLLVSDGPGPRRRSYVREILDGKASREATTFRKG